MGAAQAAEPLSGKHDPCLQAQDSAPGRGLVACKIMHPAGDCYGVLRQLNG